MKVTNRFDPTTGVATPNNTNPQNYLLLPFNSGTLRVFMVNPTAINIDIYFSNGNIAHLPARGRRFFEEDVPSGVIYWQVIGYNSSIQTSTPPFTFEIYEPYEKPPQIYPDVSPPLVPFGQVAVAHWTTATTDQVITLNNVAGQTLVLDGYDVWMSAGATNDITTNFSITGANFSGGIYKNDYFMLHGSQPITVDHVTFPGRGMPQVAGQNIVLTMHNATGLALNGNQLMIAKYHYEIPS